ncbi:MAG: hypothetical protein Ctma_0773 [Catillopecten margaritatus gill symbiont]|uniref:PIN domain-containing protein n=1 Tax=Catillopecten margaritatus gill symbiont TaxID=3083288 RepID=A0AAU6PGD4_9GAMM
MNYLIDTHILVWLIKYPKKISQQQLNIFQNSENKIYISNISFWEIALKSNKGKMEILGFNPDDLPIIAKELGLKILDINSQTMANSYQLSAVEKHKDPFDRLLIWHCIQNHYTFISSDSKLHNYEKQGLKWI